MSSTDLMKCVCPTMMLPPSGISRRTDFSSMRSYQNTSCVDSNKGVRKTAQLSGLYEVNSCGFNKAIQKTPEDARFRGACKRHFSSWVVVVGHKFDGPTFLLES